MLRYMEKMLGRGCHEPISGVCIIGGEFGGFDFLLVRSIMQARWHCSRRQSLRLLASSDIPPDRQPPDDARGREVECKPDESTDQRHDLQKRLCRGFDHQATDDLGNRCLHDAAGAFSPLLAEPLTCQDGVRLQPQRIGGLAGRVGLRDEVDGRGLDFGREREVHRDSEGQGDEATDAGQRADQPCLE